MPENKSQSHKDIYENKQNSERQTRDEEQERRRRAEFLSLLPATRGLIRLNRPSGPWKPRASLRNSAEPK